MSYILILSGSQTPYSASAQIAEFAQKQLKRLGVSHPTVSVRALPAEALVHGQRDNAAIQAAFAQIQQAHGVIVVTPAIKSSYSGLLKVFLDLLPCHAFGGKPILPVLTGAPGHRLALEYTLIPVLASSGADTIRPGIYIPDSAVQIGHGGSIEIEETVESALNRAIITLVAECSTLSAAELEGDWQI